MDRDKMRDGINRILFHILSNEERADRIIELLDAQRCEWKDDGYGDYAAQCGGYFSFDHDIVDDKYCLIVAAESR